MHLELRTALTLVERALVESLDLALRLKQSVASLGALAAAPSAQVPDGALWFVQSEGVLYRFRSASQAAWQTPVPANAAVVKPSDRAGAGRWLRTHSTCYYGPNRGKPLHRTSTGYARAVQLYQGELSLDEALVRIYGQRPAILIFWDRDRLTLRSTGGSWAADYLFKILCISQNLRPGQQPLEGSDVAEEQASSSDPGLYRMMGDVRYILAGSHLGMSPGVRRVDIQGEGEVFEEDLGQRLFVGLVPIKVQASVGRFDEDLVPAEGVLAQFQAADSAGPGPAYRSDCLLEGYQITPGPGLLGTPSPGRAMMGGKEVSSTPGAQRFAPHADTYRFLFSDGSFYYVQMVEGAPPPAAPAGAWLLGLTRTDGDRIVADTLLCTYSIDTGDPFSAP